MNINNFEQKIDPVILARGRNYWKRGFVKNCFSIDSHTITSLVEGTDLYDVEIKHRGEEILSTFCTCPYDQGPYCKHEAAMLYRIKETDFCNNDDFDEDDEKSEIGRAQSFIKSMDEDQIRDFMMDRIKTDASLRNTVLARFSSNSDSEQGADYYKRIIEESLERLMHKGFIGYREAFYADNAANELLEQARMDLIDDEYGQVFSIIKAVMEVMTEIWPNTDDSAGNIGGCIESAMDILAELGQAALPQKERDQLFEYLLSEDLLSSLSDVSWNWDILDIAVKMAESDDEENRIMETGKNQCVNTTDNIFNYDEEKLALLKCSLLKKRHSTEETAEYIKKNRDYSSFRNMILEKEFTEKNYEEVIRMAQEGIDKDKDTYPGLVSQWYEWLLKGAEKIEDRALYNSVSEQFYFHGPSIEKFRLLKESQNIKTWIIKREEILPKIMNNIYHYREVLIEEDMTDKLWESLRPQFTYETVEKYGKYILADYHREIADSLEKSLPKVLQNQKDRKFYARISKVLKKLSEAGEEKRVQNITYNILTLFNNRPALRDELAQKKLID